MSGTTIAEETLSWELIQTECGSILYLKCWAVLWPGMAFVIHPRRRNIRVPQPFLYLGDVGLVAQGVAGTGAVVIGSPSAG
jgi:hypothetical protein